MDIDSLRGLKHHIPKIIGVKWFNCKILFAILIIYTRDTWQKAAFIMKS